MLSEFYLLLQQQRNMLCRQKQIKTCNPKMTSELDLKVGLFSQIKLFQIIFLHTGSFFFPDFIFQDVFFQILYYFSCILSQIEFFQIASFLNCITIKCCKRQQTNRNASSFLTPECELENAISKEFNPYSKLNLKKLLFLI